MYLHKKYESQKWTAIAKLETTNSYVKRKNMIIEQNDQIMTQRRNMQSALLEAKVDSAKTVVKKSVPLSSLSSKYVTEIKMKSSRVGEDGVEKTYEQLMKESKRGEQGKRGAGKVG